ncbi:hypothetical protein [Bradyrhizobium sp. WSM4349]|uniref:hypothetical protein n=1 Tax=Bradyrhizobium sp. WSM4349 TaxID=1040988 RepID=UPI001FD8D2D1|nr:hypothetical protein [Bradyrhizobium sp. WSM4349]
MCSVSQSVAAAAALRDAMAAEVAPNGILVTNPAHAAENAADHLMHFYIFFMPDFAREVCAAHALRDTGPFRSDARHCGTRCLAGAGAAARTHGYLRRKVAA